MNAASNKVPISFSVVLLLVVAGLGTHKLVTTAGAAVWTFGVGMAIYLAWLLAESWAVSVREVLLPRAQSDKGSCEMYGIAQGTTVVAALVLSGPTFLPEMGFVGLVAMVAGFAVRWAAIVTLGRYYSRRVRLLPDHTVITGGPYRWVRHPAYLGTLVGHLGFALVFGSWVAALVWAAFFVPMVVRRILVEEPVLFALPGYADYARSHKRLVPGVW